MSAGTLNRITEIGSASSWGITFAGGSLGLEATVVGGASEACVWRCDFDCIGMMWS